LEISFLSPTYFKDNPTQSLDPNLISRTRFQGFSSGEAESSMATTLIEKLSDIDPTKNNLPKRLCAYFAEFTAGLAGFKFYSMQSSGAGAIRYLFAYLQLANRLILLSSHLDRFLSPVILHGQCRRCRSAATRRL
jgi:hypothetical protein